MSARTPPPYQLGTNNQSARSRNLSSILLGPPLVAMKGVDIGGYGHYVLVGVASPQRAGLHR